MLLLLDEDIPHAVAEVFETLGYTVVRASAISELRGNPDEVLFDYAKKHGAVLVTADVGIPNPLRFPLHELTGCILLRFPHHWIAPLRAQEVRRLMKDVSPSDIENNLVILSPGIMRIHSLSLF